MKIDKNKLTPFWREIFEEYEKEQFPLTLLGKGGYMIFKDKEDLFNYYLMQSKWDRKCKR